MTACRCQTRFAAASLRRTRHPGAQTLDRHCHHEPFIALVLAGGYLEAGDEGRRKVGAGDFLVHQPFESHLNQFAPQGADVLVLPMPPEFLSSGIVAGVASDPDAVARLAEQNPEAASRLLVAHAQVKHEACWDWPDALALELRKVERLRLSDWADGAGLRPETVSRGFRSAYGTTPKAYRANARARTALAAIRTHRASLSSLAADLGFADQAHMTRAVVALTCRPPKAWLAATSVSGDRLAGG